MNTRIFYNTVSNKRNNADRAKISSFKPMGEITEYKERVPKLVTDISLDNQKPECSSPRLK